MKKVKVVCNVKIPGIGKVKYEGVIDLNEADNVFGWLLDFRTHMKKTFPGCEYDLISVKNVRKEN